MSEKDFIVSYTYFTVPSAGDGMRLDSALQFGFPGMGVRARRRLWRWCEIAVNGKKRQPGYEVNEHDTIEVLPELHIPSTTDAYSTRIHLATFADGYGAIAKPRGIHSAHIAGGDLVSVEAILSIHWSAIASQYSVAVPDVVPRLLTRLDKDTSGLLLSTWSDDKALQFRCAEMQAKVKKVYHAVVHGRITDELYLTSKLDVEDRSITGVGNDAEPDCARHTAVLPLATLRPHEVEELFSIAHVADKRCELTEKQREILCRFLRIASAEYSLVQVDICRGARHQIRAHLAAAGFALVGDAVYAPESIKPRLLQLAHGLQWSMPYLLHHSQVSFDNFTARLRPDWLSSQFF